ncbi:diaminopimelate decarboxylase [Klugiella xanthotipulae]|uniref:Diaminopimelate decarboxylase n=1 Tax=Klugiella xanthotipulae TaxID=244735 RepID=A0A543HY17_9MICO|nr:diaminopimelate decarboxylase [Klugiella xanthotipulae]TQM63247.1 diaminopimelate decarboxylase [Klugiella xanthotipulae]
MSATNTSLSTKLFSRGVARAASGEATVAGVPVTEIAQRFGTPVYVVDEMDARGRAAEIRAAFDSAFTRIGTTATVYYAGKAFLCTEVARWMVEAGLGVDVASGGELAVALAAGVPPQKIGVHGNNKSRAEIDAAVSAGVGSIVIDSLVEIERVAEAARRYGVTQPVRLRVNSGVHASTHEFLATAHEDQKFGLPITGAPAAVAAIRSHGSLRFLGLHCHIGSQIFAPEGFAESAARLLTLHRDLLTGGPVPELNLGGGFGIAYLESDDPPAIADLANQIADTVRDTAAELNIPLPVVAFEPGRAVIGSSTLTLYTVGTIKPVELPEGGVRTYVSVDGGMSDNARPSLYNAEYTVRLVSRDSAADPLLIRLAGKHCESGDILIYNDYLPSDIAADDLVAVPGTGAYCWSLSSNYNYLGRPPVVAVREGEARLIVRGEGIAELLSRDCGIPAGSIPATKRGEE